MPFYYLKQLCEKKSGSQNAIHFPPEDSDSETMFAWALQLPADLKFAYMVRETSILASVLSGSIFLTHFDRVFLGRVARSERFLGRVAF